MFSLISAVGKNNEIGHKGDLIFHIKDDMQFFKDTTDNHIVVMGRKTWESLPGKLDNRKNIVISHYKFKGPDLVLQDTTDFIEKYQDVSEEVFIIGGASAYQKFLPYAKNIYLTEISTPYPYADTFFPTFDKTKYVKELIKKGNENGLEYSIIKYIKKEEK